MGAAATTDWKPSTFKAENMSTAHQMTSEGTTTSEGDTISGSIYSQEENEAILVPPDKAFGSDTDRLLKRLKA